MVSREGSDKRTCRYPSDAVTVCLVPKIFREDKPPSEAREYTHKNLAKTAGWGGKGPAFP